MSPSPASTAALPTPGTDSRPFFSVCVPAFNRAHFLRPLLDSVLSQDFDDFELIVSEDMSPQREAIRAIVAEYGDVPPGRLRYVETPRNLGYDANIRRLVELSTGRYCFFLGNDDLLVPGALRIAAGVLKRHPQAGMLLRGYSWFDSDPAVPADTVRYVAEETVLAPGEAALTLCYRRSGVISGYVIDRDPSFQASTDQFDGSLYYQMHLTASVLVKQPAVVIPDVLVLCRNSEAPEFGIAPSERGRFTPGRYTPEARINMVLGALKILQAHPEITSRGIDRKILRDYARHFYPFLRDQLGLPLREYVHMCRTYAATDLGRFPAFYVNCIMAYALGQRTADALLKRLRAWLGRTPRLY